MDNVQTLPQGWFSENDIKVYRSLAERVPHGGKIIELGVWKGRSLCSIADIIKRRKLKVYAVDTFKGTENEGEAHAEAKTHSIEVEFRKNMKAFKIRTRVFVMDTNKAAETIKEEFDLVFIDADHSFEAVKQDIDNWSKKCIGIIAGHDFELESVNKAVVPKYPDVHYHLNSPTPSSIWHKTVGLTKRTKRIDVIIPAFKAQGTIVRCLSSIAMQSIVDQVMVTIVNDADGIGYAKYVDMFKDHMAIQEITLPVNGGPGVARQYGIDYTSASYLTFIDADDTFSGTFSLQILLYNMDLLPTARVIVGGFIEELPNLMTNNHVQDLIWMFGKLYSRAFLDKYNIRFNETRANEDNGFNTLIKLLSSEAEQVYFIKETIYYWHYKFDSITRINNGQYSFDQSFVGYVDNMIYAIKAAQKLKPFNPYIKTWAIQVMASIYVYFCQTVKWDNRFISQNFNSSHKYYIEVYRNFEDSISNEVIEPILAEVISQRASLMSAFIPEKTIFQFIESLKEHRIEV